MDEGEEIRGRQWWNAEALEAIAGKEGAKLIFDGDIVNYEDLDEEAFHRSIQGSIVLGAAPTAGMMTDGIAIYLLMPDKRIKVIELEADTTAELGACPECGNGLFPVLRISIGDMEVL